MLSFSCQPMIHFVLSFMERVSSVFSGQALFILSIDVQLFRTICEKFTFPPSSGCDLCHRQLVLSCGSMSGSLICSCVCASSRTMWSWELFLPSVSVFPEQFFWRKPSDCLSSFTGNMFHLRIASYSDAFPHLSRNFNQKGLHFSHFKK